MSNAANGTAEAISVDVDPEVTEVAMPEDPLPTLSATAQRMVEDRAAAPPPPKKLEEIDIMKLENAFLKVDNLRKARSLAEKDIQNIDGQLAQVQQNLIALRDSLSQKYSVDLTKARINTDGTILPNANPGLNAPNPIAQALGKN